MTRGLALLLLLSGCSAVTPVAQPKADARIPVEFHGEWSSDPATCGIEGDDMDSRVWIDAQAVGFYGETHVVTAVVVERPRVIALAYAAPVAGDHHRTAPVRLTLSADGKSLSAPEGQGTWQRCPKAKSPPA